MPLLSETRKTKSYVHSPPSRLHENMASTKASASKGWRSSTPSPTPTNFTGMLSSSTTLTCNNKWQLRWSPRSPSASINKRVQEERRGEGERGGGQKQHRSLKNTKTLFPHTTQPPLAEPSSFVKIKPVIPTTCLKSSNSKIHMWITKSCPAAITSRTFRSMDNFDKTSYKPKCRRQR